MADNRAAQAERLRREAAQDAREQKEAERVARRKATDRRRREDAARAKAAAESERKKQQTDANKAAAEQQKAEQQHVAALVRVGETDRAADALEAAAKAEERHRLAESAQNPAAEPLVPETTEQREGSRREVDEAREQVERDRSGREARENSARNLKELADINRAGTAPPITDAERDGIREISDKIGKGQKLSENELNTVLGVVSLAQDSESSRDASEREIPPALSAALVGTAPLPRNPFGGFSSFQVGAILTLATAGVLALTAEDILNKTGFNPQQGIGITGKPIDSQPAPTFTTFPAPMGVTEPKPIEPPAKDIPAGTIDTKETTVGPRGITVKSTGLAGAARRLEETADTDPSSAVREAERIIREAQKARAAAGARLKDARAEGNEGAARSRAESEELERLDDVIESTTKLRQQLKAQAQSERVSSTGPAQPKATPKTGTPTVPATEPKKGQASSGARPAQATGTGTVTGETEPETFPPPPPPDLLPEPKPVEIPQRAVGRGVVLPDLTNTGTEAGKESKVDASDSTTASSASQTGSRTTSRTRTATRTTGPVPPPIRLPRNSDLDDDGKPDGRFPRKVQWRQGVEFKQYDLVTSRLTRSKIPAPGGVRSGRTPAMSLKVIKRSSRKPRVGRFRLGAVVAEVKPKAITFKKFRGGFDDEKKSPGFKG